MKIHIKDEVQVDKDIIKLIKKLANRYFNGDIGDTMLYIDDLAELIDIGEEDEEYT